ncbi:MAG: YraN family protein [Candidatus Staskawiczbacteria bacterium]|nr:YraN family protein [Candidatus Staskawiczbacteria bacterium]
MSTKKLGDYGENLACEYLVNKGYKILFRNHRIKFGEIDIIAKKKKFFIFTEKIIHFIEVKTILESDGFFPEDRVDLKKQKKLSQLAEIWMKNNFKKEHPYQIDVVGIAVNKKTSKAKIRYFENAVSGI